MLLSSLTICTPLIDTSFVEKLSHTNKSAVRRNISPLPQPTSEYHSQLRADRQPIKSKKKYASEDTLQRDKTKTLQVFESFDSGFIHIYCEYCRSVLSPHLHFTGTTFRDKSCANPDAEQHTRKGPSEFLTVLRNRMKRAEVSVVHLNSQQGLRMLCAKECLVFWGTVSLVIAEYKVFQ